MCAASGLNNSRVRPQTLSAARPSSAQARSLRSNFPREKPSEMPISLLLLKLRRHVLARQLLKRYFREIHDVVTLVRSRQVHRIRDRIVAPERRLLRIYREALDDMQLLAVKRGRRQYPCRKPHGIDHQRIAFPAADRVAGIARRETIRMLGHADVDPAVEVVQTVLDIDDFLAARRGLLLEPVD